MVGPDRCHDGNAWYGDRMTWAPYYPPNYPIQDGIHNPWVTIDPISGDTAYRVWLAMDRTTDVERFKAKLAELRSIK